METLYCSIKSLSWDNRGMLMGPYCPIYGAGAVLTVLICGNLTNKTAIFFLCMAGSAILEYITSYTTEKLFHAVWWDYSNIPFNLNGRICLTCSLGFGAAGLIILYGIHPYISKLTDIMPLNLQESAALFLMAVFAADCALTADTLVSINLKIETTIKAFDAQISDKYETFIKNTIQNITEGIGTIKEKISFEEFHERNMKDELKKTISSMNRMQIRAFRSSKSLRWKKYGKQGNKIKQTLSFRKKKKYGTDN